MATGNDLNPCRVVDVEWRWLMGASYKGKDGSMVRVNFVPKLQTRKLVRRDRPCAEWTEWQDVPVVEV